MQEDQTPQIPVVELSQTTTMQTVNEKPKKNNFLVILLSTLLFISIVIASFFAYQTQNLAKELQGIKNKELVISISTPSLSSEATTNPTTDWKTYVNTKYKFSFSYPKELIYLYDQLDGGNLLLQNFDGAKLRTAIDSDFQIGIWISKDSGITIEQLAKNAESKEIVTIKVNGISAIKGTSVQKYIDVPTIWMKSEGNVFVIQLSHPNSTNKEWFDKILSTFKFTN